MVGGARTVDALEGIERVKPFAVDLADPDAPARLVGHAIEIHGRIDVLVNNVGAVHVRLGGFLGTTDAELRELDAANFFAALRATRAALTDDGQAQRRRHRQRRIGQLLLRAGRGRP